MHIEISLLSKSFSQNRHEIVPTDQNKLITCCIIKIKGHKERGDEEEKNFEKNNYIVCSCMPLHKQLTIFSKIINVSHFEYTRIVIKFLTRRATSLVFFFL